MRQLHTFPVSARSLVILNLFLAAFFLIDIHEEFLRSLFELSPLGSGTLVAIVDEIDLNHEVGTPRPNALIASVGGVGFVVFYIAAMGILALYPAVETWRLRLTRFSAAMLFAVSFSAMTLNNALVYQIGGICRKVSNIDLNIHDTCAGAELYMPDTIDALFFSLTMLTSLGFGDLTPSQSVMLFSAAQSISGYVLLGTGVGLIVDLVRRDSRDTVIVRRIELNDRTEVRRIR